MNTRLCMISSNVRLQVAKGISNFPWRLLVEWKNDTWCFMFLDWTNPMLAKVRSSTSVLGKRQCSIASARWTTIYPLYSNHVSWDEWSQIDGLIFLKILGYTQMAIGSLYMAGDGDGDAGSLAGKDCSQQRGKSARRIFCGTRTGMSYLQGQASKIGPEACGCFMNY